MDQRWMLPSVCAAVVWFALSKNARGVRGEDVVALTPETFEQEVGLDNGVLVEFYVSRCDYCKKLAPEYESLASFFKSTRNVLIAKVDCDKHKSLCSKYDIKRFPTIMWFPKGSLEPRAYHGKPTALALAKFVNRVLRVKSPSAFGSALFLLLLLYYFKVIHA